MRLTKKIKIMNDFYRYLHRDGYSPPPPRHTLSNHELRPWKISASKKNTN